MIELTYIAAPSYSGSTLLTVLLSSHPDIATVGELKWGGIDLATYRCSCGALLVNCAFWRGVRSRVESANLPFDLQRPPTDFRLHDDKMADRVLRARNRGPLFESVRGALTLAMPRARSAVHQARQVNKIAIESVLHFQRGRMFLDASKDPVRLQYLMKTGDYSVRVLHLIRDCRGVVNSTVKKKGLDAETAALDWERTHGQIERIAGRLHEGTYHRVRYEDICRDAAIECESIHAFLGLNPSKAAIGNDAATQHILGNAMRLQSIDAVKLDEKWRDELDEAALTTIESVAGIRNRRYGYT